VDIILHLGGNPLRATKAAELAIQYPDATVVISSEGGDHGLTYYDAAGIDRNRIKVDMQAWDTVTNFTHTYKLLRRLNVTHLFVVTDSSHMPRSLAIAKQVWGGRVPIEGHSYQDGDGYKISDATHIKADVLRAWMWRTFGILPYWNFVKETRRGDFPETEKHSFLEIGF
jgi:uncharacterized SAM-binding protein YcdF (DUF218 family)